MKSAIIVALALCIAAVTADVLLTTTGAEGTGISNGCSYTYTPSGQSPVTYDLSAMTKGVGGGDFKGQDTAYDYKANVCGSSNGGTGCTDKDYSICQYNQQTQAFVASLGSFKAQDPVWSLITLPGKSPEPYTAGVMYSMTNGDVCWIAGRQQMRTALNVFRCAQTPSDIITVDEDPTSCTFTITFQSTQACPGGGPTPSTGGGDTGSSGGASKSGLSGGWIFIIVLLVVVPIYVAVGCVYKVKRQQAAPGRAACPNNEFWCALPGLVKDGCKYTFNMIKSGCKSGKGEGYNEL